MSGEKYYFIKDRTYHIHKGSIILINAMDLHRSIDAGAPKCERFLINFKPELFANGGKNSMNELLVPFHKEINVIRLHEHDQHYVEQLFKTMSQEIIVARTGHREMLTSYLLHLLVFITRYTEDNRIASEVPKSAIYEKAAPIVKYINTHYMEPLTLKSISDALYISPYYLCSIFKKYTDFTLIEYLHNIRIREAQNLLRKHDCNVTEVAERVGFGSISQFGRVFKMLTGTSPREYRKMLNDTENGTSAFQFRQQ